MKINVHITSDSIQHVWELHHLDMPKFEKIRKFLPKRMPTIGLMIFL